jgi:hypothetical protein
LAFFQRHPGPAGVNPTLLEEAINVCIQYLSMRDIVLPDPKANIIVLLFQIYTPFLPDENGK